MITLINQAKMSALYIQTYTLSPREMALEMARLSCLLKAIAYQTTPLTLAI